jgi:hypothetical protein
MKLLAVISLLFLLACGERKEAPIMPGAYMMKSQSVKSSTLDTTYLELQQLKIYTGDYMMYANFNARDSVSAFGIGSYDSDKDTVTEHVIYSAADSSRDDTLRNYKLFIQKSDSGYKQVIPDMQTQNSAITLTEVYKTVGKADKSPLDGVWKEIKTYVVKGNDTTKHNTTQFKAYYQGYYIWGHTYSDTAKKVHTGMGFGKYTMNGDKKLTETCLTSNYPQIRGRDNQIEFEMNGEDEYKQTISYPNNEKSVEIYQRIK